MRPDATFMSYHSTCVLVWNWQNKSLLVIRARNKQGTRELKAIHTFPFFHLHSDFLIFWQRVDHVQGLQAHADYGDQQVEDVLAASVVIGIALNAAGLVCCDLIFLHDPFNRGLTIDDVLIRPFRDVGNGNPVIVLDRVLLRNFAFLGEAHLLHCVILFGHLNGQAQSGGISGLFIMQMEVRKLPANPHPFRESVQRGNARQFLGKVVRIFFYILLAVQHSIDIAA